MSENFLSLSASKLNLYADCKTCFWLAYSPSSTRIERPRGIFPSLPGGMDRVIKAYVDTFRDGGDTLPSGLELPAGYRLYPDQQRLEAWRNWRTGLKVTLTHGNYRIGLIGALDDALIDDGDLISPFDIKTKGDVPKDDGSQFYGPQMDMYAFLLEQNGCQTNGKGYLWYFWPHAVLDDDGLGVSEVSIHMTWQTVTYELEASAERAEEVIHEAADLLLGPCPFSDESTCEYCRYVNRAARMVAFT